jgi:hypothetical protein
MICLGDAMDNKIKHKWRFVVSQEFGEPSYDVVDGLLDQGCSVSMAAQVVGVQRQTLANHGFKKDKAKYRYKGLSMCQWAGKLGVSKGAFSLRVKRHGIEKAVRMGGPNKSRWDVDKYDLHSMFETSITE